MCGRIWQRGAPAGLPAVRVVGACSPVGCVQAPVSAPASVGAERSPPGSSTRGGRRDKSFCPCHKTGENTGFSPVFCLPVLHGNGVHVGSDSGFSHPFAPALNRSHPLQHPKRTWARLFGAFPGAFSCFCHLLTCKIFRIFFVHFAIWLLKIEVIGDSIQSGCILFHIVQFCDLAGTVA